MKTLVIGDIHGCYDEMLQLIEKADMQPGDQIIAVGDIIDRGPKSKEAIQYFIEHKNAQSILGNHERKHIKGYRQAKIKSSKETNEHPPTFKLSMSQLIAKYQMGEEFYQHALDYMQTLPLYIELPDAYIFHGFFEPSIPLENQEEKTLVGVLSADFYLKNKYEEPWYSLYDGEKPAICGHID
ncbi:MAG: hypothetical protein GF364_07190, partial [Candidatus Lokiarchaeota archaeon]|nr:hypothetical protein [Candidatus Lokiarchaeota archaeon]